MTKKSNNEVPNDITKLFPLAEIDKTEFEEKETPARIGRPKISFDAYFEILKFKNNEIREWHKDPIRKFFKQLLGTEVLKATESDFDELFKKY